MRRNEPGGSCPSSLRTLRTSRADPFDTVTGGRNYPSRCVSQE